MTIWRPNIHDFPGPRYEAIACALASDIAHGALAPGERLPTHRALAEHLGVTVGTVSRAYREAEYRGLIEAMVGRGTFVCDHGAKPPDAAKVRLQTVERGRNAAHYTNALGDHWASTAPLASDVEPGDLINLRISAACSTIYAPVLAECLAELLRKTGSRIPLGYMPAHRLAHHRAVGAAWLAESGVTVDAERVSLTMGAQNGAALAFGVITEPGDVIATEALTYAGGRTAAALSGVNLVGVTMDAEGMVPDALDALCQNRCVKALYTVPTIHNPTTRTQSVARRAAIMRLAAQHDLLVIEDDTFAFLGRQPDGSRFPTLWSYDPDRVFFLSSLAKSVAPGLRIGFMAAPSAYRYALAAAMGATFICVPPLMAALATKLIEDGTAQALAEAQRTEATRRQALAAQYFNGMMVEAAPAAFHLWIGLPPSWGSATFAAAARERNVLINIGENFDADGKAQPSAFRVCLQSVNDLQRLDRGLATIAGLLRETPDSAFTVI